MLIICLSILVVGILFIKLGAANSGQTDKMERKVFEEFTSLLPSNKNENELCKGYSISSCNEYATETGVSILEAGGNAVDAAIAMSYTLAVTEPYASGLGGGGCMLIYDPDT